MATQYTNQELMDRTEKLIADSMGDYLPRSLEEKRPGKLIVLEGPDGSGRSSQMALLSEWLEWQGFAVQTMGLKRSKLLASDLEQLQHNTDLQLMTRIFAVCDRLLRSDRKCGSALFAPCRIHRAGRPLHTDADLSRRGSGN